jgi:hypothetical protein
MSQLIEFLGKVGSDASLRYGGRNALLRAMNTEGLDVAFHESVADGDAKAVKRALHYHAMQMPNAQMVQMGRDFQATQMGVEYQVTQMGMEYQVTQMGMEFQATQMGVDYQITQMGTELQPR